MVNLEIVALENGRFTVLAADEPGRQIDAGEFETRVEAEAWLFQKSEQLEGRSDPEVIRPGDGQGAR